jgi:hypothetical protein
VGDRVWLQLNKEIIQGPGNKTKALWYSPFEILEKVGDNVGYVLYSLPTYFRRFRADILSSGRHISGTTYFRDHMILGGFRHMVFADGFLFPVKELGFWTNPGHWVRVLDAAGSYMYIVL